MGLKVRLAEDGEQALQATREKLPDLILMDIQLPGMDGYQTTEAIRKLPDTEALPILAMTAHAMQGDQDKTLQTGMASHVTKPINPLQLYRELQRWLPGQPE